MLQNLFTSCKRSPMNKIFKFVKNIQCDYVIPWYIMHFKNLKIKYVGYDCLHNTTELMPFKQSLLFNKYAPIFIFSCLPKHYFHVQQRNNRLILSLILDINSFKETEETHYPISLHKDIMPWIKTTHRILNLNVDINIYYEYINDNIQIIKTYYTLAIL